MELVLDRVTARHPAARVQAPDALRGVSLRIRPGEAVAVIGPSGAGKTSLLHVAAAALRPRTGSLTLGGVAPWKVSASGLKSLRQQLFLAPQTPPLPPRQRVVLAVLAGRLPEWGLLTSLRNWLMPTQLDQVQQALARFDLADKVFDRVDRLSGGERQRVGLARALMSSASLWLIDEPLSALDPARARQALDTLINVARERQVAMLASLHQVDLALACFPRVIGLRDGQVLFDAASSEVTEAQLKALYAQFEHERHGAPATAPESADATDLPARKAVPMTCR